jgi:hypothetical protein
LRTSSNTRGRRARTDDAEDREDGRELGDGCVENLRELERAAAEIVISEVDVEGPVWIDNRRS